MKKVGLIILYVLGGILCLGGIIYLVSFLLLSSTSCDNNNPEIIDDCVTVDGEDSCAVDIDEPIVEEPIVEEFNIENYINGFAGTILNGTEIKLFDITGDNTLYYNDQFGFAVILGEQWKGGKVELKTHNEQFGENAINRSIHFYKEGFEYDVYSLTINKIEKYDSMKKQDVFWTEDEFEKGIKGKNNKYLFMGYANDQLAPYIDTTNEYQQLFLNGFVFYDVDVQVKNPIKVCVHYFDGCNRCTMQDDGNYICTEEACEQHQQPYCDEYDMINL